MPIAEADDPGEDRQLGERGFAPRRLRSLVGFGWRAAASRPGVGHPDETLTRHQPINIPSGPRTGRECQCPQPGQAEVGAADPQPAVGGGGGKHVVEQLAVGVLDGGALGERALRVGDAGGEGVAELLELTEVEHPRRPGGSDPVRDVDPAEPLGDQPGELALEPPDLPPQLGPRTQLVARPRRLVPSGYKRPLSLSSRSGIARF